MARVILSIVLVLAVIYIVPFVVYGLASVMTGLQPPQGASAAQFLLSVLVSKVGTAVGFVLIFRLARDPLSERWPLYALVWWLMFVFGEIGQTIGPNYTWLEALLGVISETIYFPLSACLTYRLLRPAHGKP